jgi:hypothetical protein
VDRSGCGQFANGPSDRPSVSATGNAVGYDSFGTNLARDDVAAVSDVFLTRIA